jgi:hypothetical protein
MSRNDRIANTERFYEPRSSGGFNPSPRGKTGPGLLGNV